MVTTVDKGTNTSMITTVIDEGTNTSIIYGNHSR